MPEYSWLGLENCRVERSLAGDVAVFSEDMRYRYALTRGDAASPKPVLGVVMLNPSTADAFKDDRTISRVRGFAERWGYGLVVIGNLFAFRSPYPRDLKKADDPAGPANKHVLDWMLERPDAVLVAWGATRFGADRARAFGARAKLLSRELLCLGTNDDGSPIHPLSRGKNWVPADTDPTIWEAP